MLILMKLFYTFWILLAWGLLQAWTKQVLLPALVQQALLSGGPFGAVPIEGAVLGGVPAALAFWLLWKTWRYRPAAPPPAVVVMMTSPEPTPLPSEPDPPKPLALPSEPDRNPLANAPETPAQVETLDERLDRARRARLASVNGSKETAVAQTDKAWSFESDCERYERLLAQVRSGKFWAGDKPGRPSKQEFQRQVERLEGILAQLRDAAT